jgi:protein translocase SecG subunit
MLTILSISILVLGVLLIAAILLQAREGGLGAAFGGEGRIYHSKRGAEKKLHQITIVLAILFFGASLAHLLS